MTFILVTLFLDNTFEFYYVICYWESSIVQDTQFLLLFCFFFLISSNISYLYVGQDS